MLRSELLNESISPYYSGMGAEPETARAVFLHKYDSLPTSLQNFLKAEATADALAELSEKNDLSVLQTELTTWVVRNVATGERDINQLPNLLVTVAEIDPGNSIEVANYIVQTVLAPVIAEIMQIQAVQFGGAIPPPTTNTTAEYPKKNIWADVAPPVLQVQPPRTVARTPIPPLLSKPQPYQQSVGSFHEQNMGQKDIMETGGNVLDLRNQ